jgi:branched-chain amino acid transport system ATP-binding protein
MSEPLLRIESLTGGYGAIRILQGVDLAVDAGSTTALLGANGAGKTTLMKTLAGVLPASAGRIWFRGEEITGASAAARVLAGIVLVPEGRLVFPELSVHDNLRLGAVNSRARAGWRPRSTKCMRSFRSCSNVAIRPRRRSRAASSRCWRSAAA